MITKKGCNDSCINCRDQSFDGGDGLQSRKRVVAKKVFNEFCDSSTIHGLKYLGTRPMHEKLWWIMVFCVSITLCGFQIRAIWIKWDQNPVIVSFNENFISISEISFPAVTICHQIKSKKSEFNYGNLYEKILKNGIEESHNFDENTRKFFELIAQTCIKDGNYLEMMKLLRIYSNTVTTFENISLLNVAPTMMETLKFCTGVMVHQPWECVKGFATILTDDGVCYTFNMLNRTELLTNGTIFGYEESFPPSALNWSFDISNMDPTKPKFDMNNPFYPMRVFTTGQRLILQLASNTEDDFDQYCPGLGERFRVYLHSPEEPPWMNHQFYDIDIRTVATLNVKPQIVLATDNMRNLNVPKRRKCVFDGERQLKFFKHYTKRNCELECLANITLSICGCARFSYPRNASTRICGLSDYYCVIRNAWFYFNVETASAALNSSKNFQGQYKCDCWSSCQSISYGAEMRSAKLFDAEKQVFDAVSNETVTYETSKLVINFKDTEFFAMKRSESYGLTDFIANCGGLLGLFMGVSLLSFVEIIYFFTVRFFSGLIHRKKM